jgi:DNA-binding IclR family transcriptional regulator
MQDGSFTAKDAAALWKSDRSSTSRSLTELQRSGYVMQLEGRAARDGRGRPATLFGISGAALLAYG